MKTSAATSDGGRRACPLSSEFVIDRQEKLGIKRPDRLWKSRLLQAGSTGWEALNSALLMAFPGPTQQQSSGWAGLWQTPLEGLCDHPSLHQNYSAQHCDSVSPSIFTK